jgi:hypothetical protein
MFLRLAHIRLVCLITAGLALFVAPAIQAGSAPAAKGPVPVRIELTGKAGARGSAGRFTLSAWPGTIALFDRGRFVDHAKSPPVRTLLKSPLVRTLYGTKGTIELTIRRDGLWTISKGTKAYAGLHGQGTQTMVYGRPSPQRSMRATMIGTIAWGPRQIG